MRNQQQKKKTPITAIVMFVLAALSAVGLVEFLFDPDESIGNVIAVIIWLIGFATLGILSLKSSAKSLGWLAGAVLALGVFISNLINGLDSNYEAVLGGILFTIVFIVIFIIKNIKHKK